MPSDNKTSFVRHIAGLVMLGLIVCGLLWIYHGSGRSMPREEVQRYEALGQIIMPEIKKIADGKTEVVLVLPAEKVVDPYDYTKLEEKTLTEAADSAGLHVTVERYAYGRPPSEFFVLIGKHADAGVIITDALPEASDGGWPQLAGKPGPKIILHGVPEIQAQPYLQAHLIQMGIVYKLQDFHESKAFNNAQECFDYHYKILR